MFFDFVLIIIPIYFYKFIQLISFKFIFRGQDNVMGLVTSLRIGSSVCLVMPYIKHDHPLVIN